MRLRMVAAGTRMPEWVQAGYRDYARRLPGECRLELMEIPLGRRGKGLDPGRAMADESRRMLAAVGTDDIAVALDRAGTGWTSGELARRLSDWLQAGRAVSLLIGGPDGLHDDCLARAGERWSLSPLTLPHGLVRVVTAEQLYRAWSQLSGHPYHRV